MISTKIRCYAVDDEPPALRDISVLINQFSELELIGTQSDPLVALDEIRRYKPQVVFLDIGMAKLSGMDLVRIIRDEKLSAMVVFTTAYTTHAIEAFDLQVLDYLVKPIHLARFVQTVGRILFFNSSSLEQPQSYSDTFLIRTSEGNEPVSLKAILYLEAKDHDIIIHLESQTKITRGQLSEFEKKLPHKQFVRIHKSFIVSISNINRLSGDGIYLKSGILLPLGRTFKAKVIASLQY